MNSRIEVHWRGRDFRPYEGDPNWRPGTIGARDAIAEGDIYEDGELLALGSPRRERIAARLLGKYDDMPEVFDPTTVEWQVRPYIPRLMNHGTVPAFVGPKGWGKTKFVCAFVPALILPGCRLLRHFDPIEVTEEERARDIWLLNAETHPGVLHAELLASGLTFGYRDGVPCYFYDDRGVGMSPEGAGVLIVEHLSMTSATQFDLTDEARFDYWATRLTEYVAHKPPPLTVVADGVTAMLGNNTTRYGSFTSRFKDLLRECGIPNGLATLHSPMGVNTNTPMHGIESMGQWDGLWLASSPAFPIRPEDRRYFETFPRIGDPRVDPRQIVLDDDGQLTLLIDSKPAPASSPSPAAMPEEARARVLARLDGAGPEGLWTRDACGRGDEYKPDRKALEGLLEEGLVSRVQVQQGRSRGTRWAVPAGTPDREGV